MDENLGRAAQHPRKIIGLLTGTMQMPSCQCMFQCSLQRREWGLYSVKMCLAMLHLVPVGAALPITYSQYDGPEPLQAV